MICEYRYYEDEPDGERDPRYYVRMKVYNCRDAEATPLLGSFYSSSCPRRPIGPV
jgi:hypothetical protein